MRAIGASRRQVLGSVLLEAVAVGLVASVARPRWPASAWPPVLKALLAGIGIDIPAGGVVVEPRTVIVSLIAGLGVSVASAVVPGPPGVARCRRSPPCATSPSTTRASSRVRMVIGGAIAGLGVLRPGRRAVRRRRRRRWSASAPPWCSSAWPCSARCSPAR